MMVYIIMATLFYAAANLTNAKGSRSGDSNLFVTVVNLVSFILPAILIASSIDREMLSGNKTTIIYGIIAGVFIAGFGLSLAKALQSENVGVVIPIVF